MSYISLAQEGLAAFDKKDYEAAIDKLGTALSTGNPKQPLWLVSRCESFLRISPANLQQALIHAEKAYVAANERGMRPVMIRSMHHRASALFRLGQYANADRCCLWAIGLACGDAAKDTAPSPGADASARYEPPPYDMMAKIEFKKDFARDGARAQTFRGRVVAALNKLEADDPAGVATVKKMPEVTFDEASAPVVVAPTATTPAAVPAAKTSPEPEEPEPEASLTQQIAEASQRDAASWQRFYTDVCAKHGHQQEVEDANTKYWDNKTPRYDWNKYGDKVTLSIYLKGANNHLAESEKPLGLLVSPHKVSISNLPGLAEASRTFNLALPGSFQPFLTSWKVGSVKLEIILVAAQSGVWKVAGNDFASCDKTTDSDALASPKPDEAVIPPPAKIHTLSQLPEDKQVTIDIPDVVDPTSPSVDLAAAAASAKKPSEAPKPSGPAYPTSSKKGPTNWEKVSREEELKEKDEPKDTEDFFKMLYANGPPEQRRAMMKSFVESNGTALSTDWDTTKDKVYKTDPPEGAEARKW